MKHFFSFESKVETRLWRKSKIIVWERYLQQNFQKTYELSKMNIKNVHFSRFNSIHGYFIIFILSFKGWVVLIHKTKEFFSLFLYHSHSHKNGSIFLITLAPLYNMHLCTHTHTKIRTHILVNIPYHIFIACFLVQGRVKKGRKAESECSFDAQVYFPFFPLTLSPLFFPRTQPFHKKIYMHTNAHTHNIKKKFGKKQKKKLFGIQKNAARACKQAIKLNPNWQRNGAREKRSIVLISGFLCLSNAGSTHHKMHWMSEWMHLYIF